MVGENLTRYAEWATRPPVAGPTRPPATVIVECRASSTANFTAAT